MYYTLISKGQYSEMQHLSVFYHSGLAQKQLLWSGSYDEEKIKSVKQDLKSLLPSREVRWSPELKAWVLPADSGYVVTQVLRCRFGSREVCSICEAVRPCPFWKATQERARQEDLGGILNTSWKNEADENKYREQLYDYLNHITIEEALQNHLRSVGHVAHQPPTATTPERQPTPHTPPHSDGVTSTQNIGLQGAGVNPSNPLSAQGIRRAILGDDYEPDLSARISAEFRQRTLQRELIHGQPTEDVRREIIRDGRPLSVPRYAVRVFDRGADFFDCYVPAEREERAVFPERARALGGVYNRGRKCWFFSNDSEPDVRALCIRIFRNYDPSRRFIVVLQGQKRVVLGHSQSKNILQVFDKEYCPMKQYQIKQVESLRQDLALQESLENLGFDRFDSLSIEDKIWTEGQNLSSEEWKKYEEHKRFKCEFCNKEYLRRN